MKKLIIDRKIWLHGKKQIDQTGNEPFRASSLYRSLDWKMCCIGIYLNQCGVSKKILLDKPDATSLVDMDVKLPKQVAWLIQTETYTEGGEYHINSTDSGELMKINDRSANENKIKKLFAKHDVEVEFIN